jgi:hypothetical protein
MGIFKGCTGKLPPVPPRTARFSAMARTYQVFGDIEGKLDVVRVE